MTDFETLCAAMDANPDDVIVVGAMADLLDEMGDARAEGMRVLWELGKTGRKPIRTESPAYYNASQKVVTWSAPYCSVGWRDSHTTRDIDEQMAARMALDPEWHERWDAIYDPPAYTYPPVAVPEANRTLAYARLCAAQAWADATPTAKLRWLAVTTGTEVPAVVRQEAEKWLDEFAAGIGDSRSRLLAKMDNYQEHEDYWSEGDRFDGLEQPPEFWSMYAAYTGRQVVRCHHMFGCAC